MIDAGIRGLVVKRKFVVDQGKLFQRGMGSFGLFLKSKRKIKTNTY